MRDIPPPLMHMYVYVLVSGLCELTTLAHLRFGSLTSPVEVEEECSRLTGDGGLEEEGSDMMVLEIYREYVKGCE